MINYISSTVLYCTRKVGGLFEHFLTPLLSTLVNTQILLLLAGHIHRVDVMFLSTVSKSSVYLSGISSHLAASSPRARFLGMIFGSTISELLDEPGKQLKFKAEDSDAADWRWYKDLIGLDDRVGIIADLKIKVEKSGQIMTKRLKPVQGDRQAKISTNTSSSKIVKIEEIEDESEEDDLPMYAKPDSDPSDDDEDPELVQRNKPSAPV